MEYIKVLHNFAFRCFKTILDYSETREKLEQLFMEDQNAVEINKEKKRDLEDKMNKFIDDRHNLGEELEKCGAVSEENCQILVDFRRISS